MVRGRGKGKRFSMTDNGSGEEEKIPVQKKRGRPQKPLNDEENCDNIEEGESGNTDNNVVSNKEINKIAAAENGKKKTRSLQGNENLEKVENSFENNLIKSNGFRHIGSRRKNKPRRAAEVGVECNQ